MIDGSKISAKFPTIHQKVNGKDLIYFDNAASSQKPKIVLNAIAHYYSHDNANIHRGVHYLSQKATNKFENTREVVQKFIKELIQVGKIPVIPIDERLSSISAKKCLQDQGIKTGHEKGRVDETAAAIILQEFLDSKS